jgi:pyruvate formate lyase activating enzyme
MNITGRLVGVDEVLEQVTRDSTFYDRSGGGMTLSGGEPLAQAAFAGELLRRYKEAEFGASTAIETCGAVDWEAFALVRPHTDVFLFDLKHMDPDEHRRLTGAGNDGILENACRLSKEGGRIIIRLPLIPGCNDDAENVRRTAVFARRLAGVERIDLLPYHRLGEVKYPRLGRDYLLRNTPVPPAVSVATARRLIEGCGVKVRIGG